MRPGNRVEGHAGNVGGERVGDRSGAAVGRRIDVGGCAAGRVGAVQPAGRIRELRPGRGAHGDQERERIGIAVRVRGGVDHVVAARVGRRAAQGAGADVEGHARYAGRERVEQAAIAAGRERQRDPLGLPGREVEVERDPRELRLAVRLGRDLNRESDADPVAVAVGRAVAHAEAAGRLRRPAHGATGPVEADPRDGRVEVVTQRVVAAGGLGQRHRADRGADHPGLRRDQLRAERGPRVGSPARGRRRGRRFDGDEEGGVGGRADGVGHGVEHEVPSGGCGRAAQRARIAVEGEPADAVDQVIAQRAAPTLGGGQDDRIDLRALAERLVARRRRERERGRIRIVARTFIARALVARVIAARRRRFSALADDGDRPGLLSALFAGARPAAVRSRLLVFIGGQRHGREGDPPPLEPAPARSGREPDRRQQDFAVVHDGGLIALRRTPLRILRGWRDSDRDSEVAIDPADLDAGAAQPAAGPIRRRLRGQEPQGRQVPRAGVGQGQLDAALAERHPQLDRNFPRWRGLLSHRGPRCRNGEQDRGEHARERARSDQVEHGSTPRNRAQPQGTG